MCLRVCTYMMYMCLKSCKNNRTAAARILAPARRLRNFIWLRVTKGCYVWYILYWRYTLQRIGLTAYMSHGPSN